MINKALVLFVLVFSLTVTAFAQASEKIRQTTEFTDELNRLMSAEYRVGVYYEVEKPFHINGKGYIEVARKYFNHDSSFYFVRYFGRLKDIEKIYYSGPEIGFAFKKGTVRHSVSLNKPGNYQASVSYSFIPIANIPGEETAKAEIKMLEEKLEALKKLYWPE